MGVAVCACTTRDHDDVPLTMRSNSQFPLVLNEASIASHPDVELQALRHSWLPMDEQYYVLNQTMAICRHADRLDHTREWENHPLRRKYPRDPPLSSQGMSNARQLGTELQEMRKPFRWIVSSPYYRCAQTACCIAESLKLPIAFDLDLGEVFDEVSMGKGCPNEPQIRPQWLLEDILKSEFPEVDFIRDSSGNIRIDGTQPKFPEPYQAACVRLSFKVMALVQRSAAALSSIIIVSHGDAVGSVLSMLKPGWRVVSTPYSSWVIGQRQVRVMRRRTQEVLTDEPVYSRPEQWKLKVHPDILCKLKGASEIANQMTEEDLRRIARARKDKDSMFNS